MFVLTPPVSVNNITEKFASLQSEAVVKSEDKQTVEFVLVLPVDSNMLLTSPVHGPGTTWNVPGDTTVSQLSSSSRIHRFYGTTDRD